jgi:VIT1/CCC1 family predicted Fe2+/Mn2+ transporter
MTMDRKTLNHHLEQVHNKTMLSANLKELVYGGIDGIVTTFAVVAGFAGATQISGDAQDAVMPVTIVLIFGLANLFADGFSMGVGDFLSGRAEKKLYNMERAKEEREIKESVDFEYDETILILKENGFSEDEAYKIADIYKTNPTFWVDFMMRYELEMSHPEESPVKSAVITFISFLVFGSIPLLPYIFNMTAFATQFVIASVFTAIALGLLGFIRARFTKEHTLLSMAEIMGLGMFAAFIAYFVGTLFV